MASGEHGWLRGPTFGGELAQGSGSADGLRGEAVRDRLRWPHNQPSLPRYLLNAQSPGRGLGAGRPRDEPSTAPPTDISVQ